MQLDDKVKKQLAVVNVLNTRTRQGLLTWVLKSSSYTMPSGLLGGLAPSGRETWQADDPPMTLQLDIRVSRGQVGSLASYIGPPDCLQVIDADGKVLDSIYGVVGLDALIETVRAGPKSLNDYYDKLLVQKIHPSSAS